MTLAQEYRIIPRGPARDDGEPRLSGGSGRLAGGGRRAPRRAGPGVSAAPLAIAAASRSALRALLAALFALVALLATTGCAATSDYMTESPSPRPIPAVGDMATVVFVRPSSFAKGIKTTILDGRGTFLGDSLPESHFAVVLPPGQHVFISWAENTAALQATLAPGRVYYVEVAPKLGALSARVHLLAISPRSESWDKLDEWLKETKQLVPDPVGGQRYLASRSEDVKERIRRGAEALANYDAEELAERTLHAEDGR